MPPTRNINAEFLREFLAGRKKLLKIADVIFVSKSFGFKELCTRNLLQNFPNRELARLYVPEVGVETKIDRQYVINVS